MCFLVSFLRKVGFELFQFKGKAFTLLLLGLLNSDSHGNGHADHGVVACAQEAHHLNGLPGSLLGTKDHDHITKVKINMII